MIKTTTREPTMTITLDSQTAYNDQTGDEATLSGEFEITAFHRTERTISRYATETVLTWTVTDGTASYGFSAMLPQSGAVDFGSATEYDLSNI